MPITFDVSRVPFSASGSWMSLAVQPKQTQLHFRNHHFKSNNLFAIEPIVDGRLVQPSIVARPDRLMMTAGEGAQVEICFDGADTVRMRGRGMGLLFSGQRIHAYSDGPGLVVFNFRRALRRYQFQAMRGRLQLAGAYASGEEDFENLANLSTDINFSELKQARPEESRLAILPDADGQWELAIDEFWSTWPRPERADFDACLAASGESFRKFRESMPPAPPQFAAARELAAYINWSCTMSPCGLVKRPSIFMSKNWMNNVWSWDQCFNAMALAGGQPTLAMDQMLTLVDHQDQFGAYTDAFNDIEKHYNYSKPPVHGLALTEIRRRLPQPLSADVLTTMYASLGKQANWWMTYRCPGGEGLASLPYYLHGNDSGWDNSTMFGKGVPLASPDLASLLVIQMRTLAGIAGELGKPDESKSWQQRSDALLKTMLAELWRGDRFVARLVNTGEDVECRSLIPLLPLVLGEQLPHQMRDCLKAGMQRHLTEWGLATERVDSPQYLEDGYWRGPIWAPSTFLAVTGLERSGYAELADDIAGRFCRLCATSGFAENFNAVTGQPLRDPAYTWTASVFLLLAERLAKK